MSTIESDETDEEGDIGSGVSMGVSILAIGTRKQVSGCRNGRVILARYKEMRKIFGTGYR